MAMTPMSSKLFRGLAIAYDCNTDTDARNILWDMTAKDLHLVGKKIPRYLIYPNGSLPMLRLIPSYNLLCPILFFKKYLALHLI